ncbi:MAG TPA: hypothetical protein GXZ98_02605 [Firmicutes bacterium]|nr:hypothetical protein [Bacillota bacterium]
MSTQDKPSICIILFSGDLDKALSALALAWTAAGEGFSAHIFFTFWGLALLRKERGRDRNPLAHLFKLLLPVGPEKLGLSRMNFGGLGARMMNKLIRFRRTETVGQLLKMAMERHVHFIACQGTMEIIGLKKTELISYENLTVGDVTTFLQLAKEAQIQLFI